MDKLFEKDGSDKYLNRIVNQTLKQIKEIQKEHSNRLNHIEADIKAIKEAQATHGDLLKQIVKLLTKEGE